MNHGVEQLSYDNIGPGWRIECLCGFITCCNKRIQYAGEEMDEHLIETCTHPERESNYAWPDTCKFCGVIVE